MRHLKRDADWCMTMWTSRPPGVGRPWLCRRRRIACRPGWAA